MKITVDKLPNYAWECLFCIETATDRCFFSGEMCKLTRQKECIFLDEMITSIKDYDSNIKIFIGLCGLPAEYKYTISHSRTQRIKARRLLLHERLMSEYGNRESEKMFIVPLHLSIDSEHDFPTEQRARSFRDSTLVEYCTDIVHPSDIAYNKIADRIRAYIKYAETV